MKIAALIQAHHRPDLLALLLDRLGGDLWTRYVHLDRKTDVAPFAPLRGGATFLDRRVAVNWGGRSQVAATLLLMRAALRDPTVTHCYLLSGQCYPVKTDAAIRARLAALPAGTANLVSLEPMPVSHKPYDRFTRRHLNDVRNPLAWHLGARLFPRLPDRPLARLRGIALYGGSQWWLLERDAVERIVAFLDRNRWYWRLFRFANCPDEMLIHSLLAPLGIVVGGESPTAADWSEGKASPAAVTAEAHARYAEGEALFARKYAAFHPAAKSVDPSA